MNTDKSVLDDETKENINKVSEVLSNISEMAAEKTEEEIEAAKKHELDGLQDYNHDGVIDKKDEKFYQKTKKYHQKDILKLFYFVYIFAFLCLLTKFVAFFLFDIILDLDLSKLANTLNIAIVFIGTAEGFRSFTTSLRQSTGESTGVPAYKLKYLFGYLIAFAIITAVAVFSEILAKLVIEDPTTVIPDFNANTFVNGLIGNTIAYLIARYGDKVADGIDLSSIPFFKRK